MALEAHVDSGLLGKESYSARSKSQLSHQSLTPLFRRYSIS